MYVCMYVCMCAYFSQQSDPDTGNVHYGAGGGGVGLLLFFGGIILSSRKGYEGC